MATAIRKFSGIGSPETVISAPPGSTYIQTDAAAGSELWDKAAGIGNTGWRVRGSGGGAVSSVDGRTGAVALGDLYVNETDHTKVAHDTLLGRGAANGYGSLDANGKQPLAEVNAAVTFGAARRQGLWDASLGTAPATGLGDNDTDRGKYWEVSVAGTTLLGGKNDWQPGDWIIWEGTDWGWVDNTDRVGSVDGRTGAVTLSDLYAAAAHVGSRGGHPLATTTLDGFSSAADKTKLDGIEAGALNRPERIYNAATWTSYDQVFAANTWTFLNDGTVNTPQISIPALGASPSGTKWKLQVFGAIRILTGTTATTVYIGARINGVETQAVHGGSYVVASSQYLLPLATTLDPPADAATVAFTVDFSLYSIAANTHRNIVNPPQCRVFLVPA